MKYDYLVVGAGLYGSVFAHEAATRGNAAYTKVNLYLCPGSHYIELGVSKDATYSFQLSSKDVIETFPESQTDRNDILSQAKRIT